MTWASHDSWLHWRTEERFTGTGDPDDIKADIVATVREYIDSPELRRRLVDLVAALNEAEEE